MHCFFSISEHDVVHKLDSHRYLSTIIDLSMNYRNVEIKDLTWYKMKEIS